MGFDGFYERYTTKATKVHQRPSKKYQELKNSRNEQKRIPKFLKLRPFGCERLRRQPATAN